MKLLRSFVFVATFNLATFSLNAFNLTTLSLVSLNLLFVGNAYGFSQEFVEVESPFTDEIYKVSVLEVDEANELFNLFARNTLIAFHIISDGCYERTYMMVTQAKLKKVSLGKTIAEVLNPEESVIEIPQENGPWILRWQYHVAPYLFVKLDSGELNKLIFDPSLFDRPVSQEEFVQKLSHDPNVKLDVFDLPPYISEKKQLSADVNLERLDRTMLQSSFDIRNFVAQHGSYLENTAFLDVNQNKCYQGGLLVDRGLCGN